MENDVVFRKAEPKTEVENKEQEPSEVKSHDITPHSDVETPIALYEQLKGKPYTAEYYDVEDIWDNPDLGMKDDIKAIEKYYVSKVQKNEIADGKDNFKKFVKSLEKAIGLSDMSPNTVRISKLAKYIKFMREADKIDERSRR
ncbi:MAG TPA: hypothetical protein P5098_01680 [Candidatus Dojkabacteria bacterium]|nr:hypothetical protein [Candidatus Dojkabacteria bacterium]